MWVASWVRMTIQLDAETWNRYRLRFAKLSEVLPRSERSLASVRMTEKNWMRRFETGTGFAFAKLSEVLPRSERSLATVRMTDFAKLSEILSLRERCSLRSG